MDDYDFTKYHSEPIDDLPPTNSAAMRNLQLECEAKDMAARIATLEAQVAALTADRARLVALVREVYGDLQVYGYDENFKCLSCDQYVTHSDDCTHTRAAALLAELDTEGEAK